MAVNKQWELTPILKTRLCSTRTTHSTNSTPTVSEQSKIRCWLDDGLLPDILPSDDRSIPVLSSLYILQKTVTQLSKDARLYGTCQQHSRQQHVHMQSRSSYEFSDHDPQLRRKDRRRHRKRLFCLKHICILRVSDGGISNNSSQLSTMLSRLPRTYTVANTTSNMEGLAFGSTRISHENNSCNFERIRMHE